MDKRLSAMQKKILSWYHINKRDLPWRKTADPYAILVSEVMLQQTQVDRVIPFFLKWMEHFPTLQSLAMAKKKTVLQYWSGLGYNSRALRLRELALILTSHFKAKIPQNEKELLTLPGIGPYTARAILSFAFNKEVPLIDTNIRRLLIHELKLKKNIPMQDLEGIARKLIPKGKSRVWHNAMMDYGALVVTSRKTGIKPLSPQSPFKGSDRQIRGYIIKQLLSHRRALVASLAKQYPHAQLQRVINKLVYEGIIKSNKNSISL